MQQDAPRPDTPAAGNALLWSTGSVAAFGVFLVVVPGGQPAGRTWLWVGIVALALGAVTFALALRARLRYLAEHRTPERDRHPDRDPHRDRDPDRDLGRLEP
jgi:hypothetical protein